MATATSKMKYCKTCGKNTLHVGQKPNHILHLLLTLVTGVWAVVWVYMILFGGSAARCTECGNKN